MRGAAAAFFGLPVEAGAGADMAASDCLLGGEEEVAGSAGKARKGGWDLGLGEVGGTSLLLQSLLPSF